MAYADEYVGLSGNTALSIGGIAGSVVALGSTLGTAAVLGQSINTVTGGDGTKGVVLQAAPAGDEVWVWNNSGSNLKVYPNSASGLIAIPGTSLGSAGAAVLIAANQGALYKSLGSNNWLAIKSTT